MHTNPSPQVVVDAEHPWLGLASFTEETQRFFFGRDAEIAEVFVRVRDHPLTILFGQSGLGKTSLLGAGLIPKLRVERYQPVLIRLRFEPTEPSLVEQVRRALAAVIGPLAPSTLWEALHHVEQRPVGLASAAPALLFDQFEEVFTLGQNAERLGEVRELFDQLADMVENRPPAELQQRFSADRRLALDYDDAPTAVRVVLTLREDFLSHLEKWRRVLPSLMRNRVALQLLDGVQALDAVFKPGQIAGKQLVTAEVATQIVRFVAGAPPDSPLETITAVPPLLSLICAELNEFRIAAEDRQITEGRLDGAAEDILRGYYDRCFSGLPATARTLVESRLLSPDGFRESITFDTALRVLLDAGAALAEAERALISLVDARLLVIEERGGTRRLELTHDILCRVARQSRDEARGITQTTSNRAQIPTFRIFISSPGDVFEERARAREVIGALQTRYAGRIQLEPVMWENVAFTLGATFQQSIDLTLSDGSGIDLAVFIFWSRLGAPIAPSIRGSDRVEYRSGTEWEWHLMREARAQSGGLRPAILAYVRKDDSAFEARLREQPQDRSDEILAQKAQIDSFIAREFFAADGSIGTAYHTFDRPATFAQQLRRHLQLLLDERAEATVPRPSGDVDHSVPAFVGLRPLGPQDASIFFGREREVARIREMLRNRADGTPALVMVVGASGSGKSSLVLAGALPAIVNHERESSVYAWRQAIFRPRFSAPNDSILMDWARLLMADGAVPELRTKVSLAKLTKLFEDAPEQGLALIENSLESAAPTPEHMIKLLLILDQIEDLLLPTCDERQRKLFARFVSTLACSRFIWVIGTLRSAFLHSLMHDSAFKPWFDQDRILRLGPPGRENLRQMITGPAARCGLSFETRENDGRLDERLLVEFEECENSLPLLALVLNELYERRTATGLLTHAALDTLNDISGVIARRAEDSYKRLPEHLRQRVPELFCELITYTDDDLKHRISRRVVPVSRVARDADGETLLRAFIDSHIVVVDYDGAGAVATLAHEAIISAWPRLNSWVADRQEILLDRARIMTAAQRWEAENRDPAFLLASGMLVRARQLLSTNPQVLSADLVNFVRTSDAQQAKRKKYLGLLLTMTITAVALVAFSLGVFFAKTILP